MMFTKPSPQACATSRVQQTKAPTPVCVRVLGASSKPSATHALGKAVSLAEVTRRLSTIAKAASADAAVDEQAIRAQEVRLQMARAMNATVVRFTVPEYKTAPGNWLSIVGSVDELGSWTASGGLRMKWLPGHEWVCDLILPENYTGMFEFKLVLMNDKGLCVWEPGKNRQLQVTGAFTNAEDQTVDISLHWGLREPEPISEAQVEFPDSMLEEMYARAEQAVRAMPGINAATVLLQAQQQLSSSKKLHREQVTELRAQLVALQESSKRENNRVQSRMRELERTMEKLQARLERERQVSEAHIDLLNQAIGEKKAAALRDAEEYHYINVEEEQELPPAPTRTRRRIAADTPALPIATYEKHVMAILPNYSGLSLDRLHNMLTQSVLTPKYERSNPQDLEELLTHLVESRKITVDNGIYRYRSRDGTLVGSRRSRTPRPASASPGPVVTVDATLMDLEPAVMTCLHSTTGITLERLDSMLHSVAPQTSVVTMEQLSALMNHLEVQGKVYKDRGLYRYGKAEARARSPQPARGLPEAMPHRITPVHRSPRPSSPRISEESDRIFFDDRMAAAPEGSVAGGPPGESVAGGPPAGWQAKAVGSSIMPAFDSTGAHPTLTQVANLEEPVLATLAQQDEVTKERLHMLVCSNYPEFAQCSLEELAAVLKNLQDQHKIDFSFDGSISLV